jgi:hypothetical protein
METRVGELHLVTIPSIDFCHGEPGSQKHYLEFAQAMANARHRANSVPIVQFVHDLVRAIERARRSFASRHRG